MKRRSLAVEEVVVVVVVWAWEDAVVVVEETAIAGVVETRATMSLAGYTSWSRVREVWDAKVGWRFCGIVFKNCILIMSSPIWSLLP